MDMTKTRKYHNPTTDQMIIIKGDNYTGMGDSPWNPISDEAILAAYEGQPLEGWELVA